jgi:hypothetical protein
MNDHTDTHLEDIPERNAHIPSFFIRLFLPSSLGSLSGDAMRCDVMRCVKRDDNTKTTVKQQCSKSMYEYTSCVV